jgi:hypothetical protein
MSKKKGKVAVKKAPKKAPKKVVKKATVRRAAARLTAAAEEKGRTLHVTIFISKTDRGTSIRTAPKTLFANPGDFVAWTVVNLIDGDNDVPVTLSWPEPGPWGKDPIQVRNYTRKAFGTAPAGNFKYVVSALGAEEDPELELPDGN